VGALIGFGFGGDEETMEAGAVLGVAAGEDGHVLDDEQWYIDDAIPNDLAAAIALVEHRWAIPLRTRFARPAGSIWLTPGCIRETSLQSGSSRPRRRKHTRIAAFAPRERPRSCRGGRKCRLPSECVGRSAPPHSTGGMS
jgi:hypothetical protein